jgi:hypothetical protein
MRPAQQRASSDQFGHEPMSGGTVRKEEAMMQTKTSRMAHMNWMAVLLSTPLLLSQGCAPPPIEGEWEVRCHPAGDDCPNFNVSFDAQGGIVDLDLWGKHSRESGFGRITGDQIEINIHNIFIFTGEFEGRGRQAVGSMKDLEKLKQKGDLNKLQQQLPAVAHGFLDDHDLDGDDVITRATVRRIGPLKRT